MTWAQVLEWAGAEQREFEARATRGWDRRDVIYRFSSGWTAERVTTAAEGSANSLPRSE